jgi:hypothetical protein
MDHIIKENELYPNMKMEDDLSSAHLRNLLNYSLGEQRSHP